MSFKKEIILGADHAGFELKRKIKNYLKENYAEFKIHDVGCNCSTTSVDYPNIGLEAATEVVLNNCLGIVICGSGIGISIAANKIKGARCAFVNSKELSIMARKHNDVNMIAFGERFIEFEATIPIIDAFLTTKFEGGRHQRRTNILDKFGEKPCTDTCC